MPLHHGTKSSALSLSDEDKEKLERIRNEPDFIATRRFNFSLTKLLERYPDGAPDNVIAAALLLSGPSSVKSFYNKIVKKLREKMVNSGIDLT